MEKNDFLLYNEVTYRLHACQTMEEFKPALLAQIKLVIPYTYGSFIPVEIDPETQEMLHGTPFCRPRAFEQVERTWLENIHKGYTIWLSYASESTAVRDSEILSGDSRFSCPSYRELYAKHGIYDCIQMNITYAGQPMGRLALYRTREDGVFTDQEAFYLRALGNHINLACWRCRRGSGVPAQAAQDLKGLVERYGLTRREEEVLALIFQDMNNEEILEKLVISRNTLLKHLQNLYRKCGVSSRWDLRKLGG